MTFCDKDPTLLYLPAVFDTVNHDTLIDRLQQ